jgi:hypothetical protein
MRMRLNPEVVVVEANPFGGSRKMARKHSKKRRGKKVCRYTCRKANRYAKFTASQWKKPAIKKIMKAAKTKKARKSAMSRIGKMIAAAWRRKK